MLVLQFKLARFCLIFKDINMTQVRLGLPDADEDRMETAVKKKSRRGISRRRAMFCFGPSHIDFALSVVLHRHPPMVSSNDEA